MAVELETYRRPELGFAISFPAESEILEDVQGTAVIGIEPPGEGSFRANLNVVVERLDPPLGFDDYLERSLEAERRALRGHHLLDRTPATLDGAPGLRTLAHHDVDGQAVTLEQWRALVGETAFVVSASCGTLDYDGVADTLTQCAETFTLLDAAGAE